MTKEEIEAEWLAIPDKLSKANLKQSVWKEQRKECAIAWLDYHNITWESNNENIHIFFTISKDIGDIEVDLWPTTNKLHIKLPNNKKHKFELISAIIIVLNDLVNT